MAGESCLTVCYLNLVQIRLGQKLLRKGDIRYVGSAKPIGDGHPVDGAKYIQLYPIYAERTLAYPDDSIETRRLPELARVEDRKQCRIHKQNIRVAHQLLQDGASQGFQVASELADAAMKRRKGKIDYAREQTRKKWHVVKPAGGSYGEGYVAQGPVAFEDVANFGQSHWEQDVRVAFVDVRAGHYGFVHPLGASWLNMAVCSQRILIRRALEDYHPKTPEEIIEWLEAAARG